MFGAIAPANTTLHVASLIGDGFLVEVELDAELSPETTTA
jgi:enamine deaminase RidA (YjgF/YER057c/UK114 family)